MTNGGRARVALVVLIGLFVMGTAQPALGQVSGPGPRPSAELELRTQRLDQALRSAEARVSANRPWSAGGRLVTGSISTAGGVWLLVREVGLNDEPRAGMMAPSLLLGLGAMELVNGLRIALGPYDTDTERLHRWQTRRELGPLDAETLARFEGEFCADQAVMHLHRQVDGWYSIGLAVGGGTVAGLSLGLDVPRSARNVGLVVGGLYVAFGLWQGLAALLAPAPGPCLPPMVAPEAAPLTVAADDRSRAEPAWRLTASGLSATF